MPDKKREFTKTKEKVIREPYIYHYGGPMLSPAEQKANELLWKMRNATDEDKKEIFRSKEQNTLSKVKHLGVAPRGTGKWLPAAKSNALEHNRPKNVDSAMNKRMSREDI